MSKDEFIKNLRGVEEGSDISREYLSAVYDSIQERPFSMDTSRVGKNKAKCERHSLHDILHSAKGSDSLLRGLAIYDFRLASLDDAASRLSCSCQDALCDLTISCVSKTWHQWHGVINTALDMAHLDPEGMRPSLGILLYAISIFVCLGLDTELSAFLDQLARFKAFEDSRQGRRMSKDTVRGEWLLELKVACSACKDRKLWALRRLRQWIDSIRSSLIADVQNKAQMTAATTLLLDGEHLNLDPARSFVWKGILLKKSNSTGRSGYYMFFLFSDVLIYAKEIADKSYKIHGELPLTLIKIVDWFPPSQKSRDRIFEVRHPRKSFQLFCSCVSEKKEWVKKLREAASLEMERKMKAEEARMAARRQA
jgi:hypothetical protein